MKKKFIIKQKILVMVLLAGMLLTGCGAPDVVMDEAENVGEEFCFLSSEEDVEKAQKFLQGQEKSEPRAISVIKRQQLKTLQATIMNDKFIRKMFLWEDEETDRSETEEATQGLDDWVKFEVGKKSTDNVFSGDLLLTFNLENGKKDLDELFKRLEKIGYKDMKGYNVEQYGACTFVRQGMLIQPRVTEEYKEDGTVERELFQLDVFMPAARYCYPKRYEELIEKTIGDGFYLLKAYTGGYMDCLQLQSSWNSPENPYNKQVSFYLKDDKPLQLEVKIWENADKADGLVFSASEKQTIINLITQMTGNSSEATAFVSNFRIDGEKEGTLGDKEWKLLNNGRTGKKHAYILRVQ